MRGGCEPAPVAGDLEPHLEPVGGRGAGELVHPLDGGDAVLAVDVVEPDVLELLGPVEPVEVGVVEDEPPAGVYVDQGERGAGGGAGAEALGDSLNQGGL